MKVFDKSLNLGGALSLATGALAVGLFVSGPANAQYAAFGSSVYDGSETLILSQMIGSGFGGADLITLGFQGWFSNCCGFNNEAGPDGNTNYATGSPGGATKVNNFFAFSFAGIADYPIIGVTLSLPAYTITNDLTYRIGDATALANAGELYDGSSPNLAIYNALGVGGFGSFALTPAESGTTLSFVLNGAAVSAINAALANGDQYFAVGGSVNSVPEPSTWAMMALGFAGLAFAGYRRAPKGAVAAA